MRLTTEIAKAIVDGFGGEAHAVHHPQESEVYVNGFDNPIQVISKPEHDVIIPSDLQAVAPGIRLDVQAILASRSG